MSESKDKYLDDLLAIDRMARQEEIAKKFIMNPGTGDILAGIGVRQFLKAMSPQALHYLDRLGLGPGIQIRKE